MNYIIFVIEIIEMIIFLGFFIILPFLPLKIIINYNLYLLFIFLELFYMIYVVIYRFNIHNEKYKLLLNRIFNIDGNTQPLIFQILVSLAYCIIIIRFLLNYNVKNDNLFLDFKNIIKKILIKLHNMI